LSTIKGGYSRFEAVYVLAIALFLERGELIANLPYFIIFSAEFSFQVSETQRR
jgi:hypothetical protein